jgi:hypothetical protein
MGGGLPVGGGAGGGGGDGGELGGGGGGGEPGGGGAPGEGAGPAVVRSDPPPHAGSAAATARNEVVTLRSMFVMRILLPKHRLRSRS